MQALRLLGRQASASAPRRFTAFAYGGARPMSSASAAVPEEPEEPAKEEATVAAPEPTKGAAHVLNARLKPKEVLTARRSEFRIDLRVRNEILRNHIS